MVSSILQDRPLIVAAENPWATDNRLTGSKAAVLASLHRAGLPVPPTIIVTTAAWAEFSATIRLKELVAALPDDLERLEDHLAELREKINASPLPPSLLEATDESLLRLGHNLVYRSSSCAEDGQSASFAGLFKSYLGLPPTRKAFEAGVKSVWLSAFTPNLVRYLVATTGAAFRDLLSAGCAVIVQPLMDAERSGVALWSNQRLRIEAVYGLAAPLVSGRITPDCYECIDGTWHEVIQRLKRGAIVRCKPEWRDLLPGDEIVLRVGARTSCAHLGPVAGGLAVVRLRSPLDEQPVLTLTECDQLTVLVAAAAERLCWPSIDCEWVWCAEGPVLTQARPVTAVLPTIKETSNQSTVRGLGAAPGTANGVLWTPKSASSTSPPDCILLVDEVSPEHIRFVASAKGVIARTGGILSHGAILCRELRKPLIVVTDPSIELRPGAQVAMDGSTGDIRIGPAD